MGDFDYKKENEFDNDKEEVFSKAVKAGKRTYFFDVKKMRDGELYVVITESRKKRTPDGDMVFNKHKIHLYREDFDKFAQGLSEVVDYAQANNIAPRDVPSQDGVADNRSLDDLEFESL